MTMMVRSAEREQEPVASQLAKEEVDSQWQVGTEASTALEMQGWHEHSVTMERTGRVVTRTCWHSNQN